jgi:ABC-type sugar transport system ATPase subunit
VRSPIVFLFDEPLSNLDAKMRVQMRSEISRLHAVDIAEPMGSESLVYLKAGTGNLIARIHGKHLFHLGEQVTVQLDLEKVSLFDAETEKVIR